MAHANWYGRGGGGQRGSAGSDRRRNVRERHARERADTHAHQQRERDDMADRHHEELDAMNRRHADDLKRQGQDAGPGTPPGRARVGPTAAPPAPARKPAAFRPTAPDDSLLATD